MRGARADGHARSQERKNESTVIGNSSARALRALRRGPLRPAPAKLTLVR